MNSKFLKKFVLTLLLCTYMLLGLSACGEDDSLPSLTDEEAEKMGNYAAFTLMRFDASHRSRLVDLTNAVIPTPRPKTPPEPENTEAPDSGNSSDNGGGVTAPENVSNATMYELINLPEGVNISYVGNTITDSYPQGGDEGAFALDAGNGKRLLVLSFNLTNNSSAIASVNIFSQNPVLKVTVNGEYTRTSLVTMLTDDLSTYVGDMEPGLSENLVLIIEIDGTVGDINSINISRKIDGANYSVVLQ